MIESEKPETVGAVTDAPVYEENAGELPAEKMALLTRMDFALILLPCATFATLAVITRMHGYQALPFIGSTCGQQR